MTSRPARQKRNIPIPLIILIAIVVAAWVLYWLLMIRYPFAGEPWESRGKFGDMFGGFNALFTALAFAVLLYGIRLEYKAFRRQELHSSLSAQLDSMIQLFALPEKQWAPVWKAIITAPGGPGADFSMEQAIALQVNYLDRLNAGEDLDLVPTYGRPPRRGQKAPVE